MRNVMGPVCALIAGVLAHTPAFADTPMTFFMETDPQARLFKRMSSGGGEDVYASGEIIEGTADRLLEFVRVHKIQAATIHFNSPGGSLDEGMKLGRIIRSLQFLTTIGVYQPEYNPDANPTSICASACAYAFAGGTSRFVTKYTGKLGVHQFYTDSSEALSGEAVQQVSGLIVAYLDQMGVDAKAFAISTIADRDGMIWLTPDDALKLRFANNGTESPIAEIKMIGMVPYLRVQQEHHNVTARVLFNCENAQLSMAFGIVTDPSSSAMIAENPKRSYLALNNKEVLVLPGASGAKANGSVVWIDRNLTPTLLGQLIKASNVSGWIDGFGALRYGATLEMPMVRGKIADFAKQCFAQ